jgi:PAS domain S-box-containing protein/putative nucleotidyltransferase with HDIG domain
MPEFESEFFKIEPFRLILENTSDIITVFDREGTIHYESPSLERALGYKPAELVGKNIAEFIHPEDLAGVSNIISQAVQKFDVPTCAEFRFRHKDGSWRYLEAVGKALPVGASVFGVVASRDYTYRKRIEQKLKESEENLRLITENMLDMVSLINLAGIRLYVSPSHTRTMGYKPEELIGKPITSFVHPEDLDRVNAAIERARRTHVVERVEFRSRHADGHYLWLETIGQLIVDENGSPTGAVLTGRDITERKQAEESIRRHLSRLTALRDVDMAIGASTDLRLTLNVLLEQVVEQLHVDAADVLLLNPHSRMLEYAAGRGLRTKNPELVRLPLGESLAGRVALEQHIIQVPNLAVSGTSFGRAQLVAGEGFVDYYGAPLVAKGQTRGVLEVFHRAPLEPDQEWLDFFEALAAQAAIAIDSAQLFDNLQRSNAELSIAYDSIIEGWSRALDLRDKETEGHTLRVSEMTIRLAQEIGIQEEQLVHLRRGALLHDIGKMGVPDRILLKPGPLTEDEWTIMRKHPGLAYDLLSPIPFLRPALDIPYCHHEKWDGTGYPRGLKGDQIPLSARIFAIVDVWDALRSDRPYRSSWSEEKVRAYIESQSGAHFDPRVVRVFLDLLKSTS